jgi:hypothetical protein
MDPRSVSGFFYHARMLGIVHLITLGWITASILGSLYLVGPIALRMWIPATWLDYTAFALVLIGIVGMVTSTLRITMAYGVFGLVGFLAQVIVGMAGRLLPIFAWYWAYANSSQASHSVFSPPNNSSQSWASPGS